MIGPSELKIIKYVCCDCDCLVSSAKGSTGPFSKKQRVYYCHHSYLDGVMYIPKYPYTPNWCPVLKNN